MPLRIDTFLEKLILYHRGDHFIGSSAENTECLKRNLKEYILIDNTNVSETYIDELEETKGGL